MGKVTSDISMSPDGFMAGSNDGVEQPLDDGGERLHEWVRDLTSWPERHRLAGGKTKITMLASVAKVTAQATQYLAGIQQGRGQSLDRLEALVA